MSHSGNLSTVSQEFYLNICSKHKTTKWKKIMYFKNPM